MCIDWFKTPSSTKHYSFIKWIHYILQKLNFQMMILFTRQSRLMAHWKHIHNLNSEWTYKTGKHLLAGPLCCDWTTARLATRPPGFSAFLKPCGIFLHSSSLLLCLLLHYFHKLQDVFCFLHCPCSLPPIVLFCHFLIFTSNDAVAVWFKVL